MNAQPIFAREVAETGHWYAKDGSPAYSVKSSKGVMRGTTLADARKLGLCPSVTTIQKIKAAPALTNWMVEQAILSALTLDWADDMTEPEFIASVKADSRAQAKAAAEEGTRIHNALELSMTPGAWVPPEYIPHVVSVARELVMHFPEVTDWISEASFAHPLGFGGKCDLHSPSTGIVIDFKGSACAPDDGKKQYGYGNHREQLAAYQRGLNLAPAVCANLFISRTHPGYVVMEVWTVEQIAHGWSVFEAMLELWKRENKFQP